MELDAAGKLIRPGGPPAPRPGGASAEWAGRSRHGPRGRSRVIRLGKPRPIGPLGASAHEELREPRPSGAMASFGWSGSFGPRRGGAVIRLEERGGSPGELRPSRTWLCCFGWWPAGSFGQVGWLEVCFGLEGKY